MISCKDQVAVGIVPLDAHHRSSQSAKSVYPLVIANCKEKRLVNFSNCIYISVLLFIGELNINFTNMGGVSYFLLVFQLKTWFPVNTS